VARYNLAAALLLAEGDWHSHKESVRILEELVDLVSQATAAECPTYAPDVLTISTRQEPWTFCSELNEDWRDRLRLLCRSSLASSLVFELKQVEQAKVNDPDPEREDRRLAHQNTVFNRILGLAEEVRTFRLSRTSLRSAKLAAEAVAMTAAGEAAYLLGDDKAETWLREAISRQPRTLEACLALARLLVERELSRSNDPAECRELLDRVLSLRPGNSNASYLRGLMYLCPPFADEERALKDFENAPQDARALWRRAMILGQRADSKRTALAAMALAIKRRPGIGYRQVSYCSTLLGLPDSNDLSAQTTLAMTFAAQLAKSSKDKYKAKGTQFLNELSLRRGFDSRKELLSRYEAELAALAPTVPAPDGDPASTATSALNALKQAKRELALLHLADSDGWRDAAKICVDAIRTLRRAIAIHNSQ
jgi:hypothetical protein